MLYQLDPDYGVYIEWRVWKTRAEEWLLLQNLKKDYVLTYFVRHFLLANYVSVAALAIRQIILCIL